MVTKKNISCVIIDDESVAIQIIKTHISKIPSLTLVDSFNNAIDAFECLRKNDIQLIFLDINMPDISGISFAKSINKSIKIIFTTAYRDYAVEGFELQAVDYLLKPISFDRLLKAVNNYFEIHSTIVTPEIKSLAKKDFMFVRSNRKMQKIDFEDIIYIESYSDYLKIHLSKTTIVTRETISAIEARLPNQHFIRIHRSYIVSIKNITSFNHEEIHIQNTFLTISRSYKKDVLKILNTF